MSDLREQQDKQARTARIMTWMALRSSRNQSLVDKVCRWVVNRAVTKSAENNDFMRDELVDNDLGFRPEDLEAYEKSGQP